MTVVLLICAAVAGILLGSLAGLLGGALGGWTNAYFDPLFRIARPDAGTRLKVARDGLGLGLFVGAMAGAVTGGITALLAGFVSPVLIAFAAAVIVWVLLGMEGESVIGSPGGPLAGAVCGVAGGYAGRIVVFAYVAPILVGT